MLAAVTIKLVRTNRKERIDVWRIWCFCCCLLLLLYYAMRYPYVRKLVAETRSRAGICFYSSGIVATAGAGRGAVRWRKSRGWLDGGFKGRRRASVGTALKHSVDRGYWKQYRASKHNAHIRQALTSRIAFYIFLLVCHFLLWSMKSSDLWLDSLMVCSTLVFLLSDSVSANVIFLAVCTVSVQLYIIAKRIALLIVSTCACPGRIYYR